jgi:hypothetical protein
MDIWGNWDIVPTFLSSARVADQWLASRPGRFTPEKGTSSTHWIVDLVGHRIGLDEVEKRKILPSRELNPGCPARSLLLFRLSYPCSFWENVKEINSGISFSCLLHMIIVVISSIIIIVENNAANKIIVQ